MARKIDISGLIEEDNIEALKTALTTAATISSNPKLSRILVGASVALGIGRSAHKYFK